MLTNITLSIERIVIVPDPCSTDTLFIHVKSLPNPFPIYSNYAPILKMEVSHGDGEKYCQENFPNTLIEMVKK